MTEPLQTIIEHAWTRRAELSAHTASAEIRAAIQTVLNQLDCGALRVASKSSDYTAGDFAAGGFRVVPPAIARRGAFIGRRVVLMPSFVNIGAYIDENTM